MNTIIKIQNDMVARYVRKGGNATEGLRLFNEMITEFKGDNLAFALCYWGFATESKAYAYIKAVAA